MSKLPFFRNDTMCLGVEIEVQLIDPFTGDLKPVGEKILQDLAHLPSARHIKSEIFQSMLEIETPICTDAFQTGASLRKSLEALRKAALAHDARVIMSGTHPFALYNERQLTSDSRYYELVDRNQWITRRLQIFGLHVHLGMKDGTHAILMNNALCHYLPIVLALSASSPYWHREDTGLASSRITFFEAIPTGGHPYLLKDWAEFEQLVDKLMASKSIKSIKDLWWDIRPNIDYGTIEVRIADCPPTIREVEALVALIHCLGELINSQISNGANRPPPPEWILRENKWRASRHGVQSDLITDEQGLSVPFGEIWTNLRHLISQTSANLKYEPFMAFLDEVVIKGPSYVRQRASFVNGFEDVIRHLSLENESDQPIW